MAWQSLAVLRRCSVKQGSKELGCRNSAIRLGPLVLCTDWPLHPCGQRAPYPSPALGLGCPLIHFCRGWPADSQDTGHRNPGDKALLSARDLGPRGTGNGQCAPRRVLALTGWILPSVDPWQAQNSCYPSLCEGGNSFCRLPFTSPLRPLQPLPFVLVAYKGIAPLPPILHF